MNKSLIFLRFKQVGRYLLEVGWLRLAVLLGLLAIWGRTIISLATNPTYAYLFAGAVFMLAVTTHTSRSDHGFLRVFGLANRWQYVIEYYIFASPIIVLLAVQGYWWASMALAVCTLPIAWLPSIKLPSRSTQLSLPFAPKAAFEWKAGFREQLPNLVVLYLLIFGFFYLVFVLPLAGLFVLLIFSRFYTQCESREMLSCHPLSPGKFLWRKILLAWKCSLQYFSPLVLLYMLVHHEYWWLGLYVFVAGNFLLMLAIIFKYALFEPGAYLRVNAVLISVAAISFAVPYFAPVPFVIGFIYYRKATKNLKFHLHA